MTTVWKKFKRLIFGKRQRLELVQQVIDDGEMIAEGTVIRPFPLFLYLEKGEPFEIRYEVDEDEL